METITLNSLKGNLLEWVDKIVQDQKHILWKFWLYYFLMRNRQLKRSQIGEIEDFLSRYEPQQDDLQSLDEGITTFLLGYRILQFTGNERQFRDKAENVKEELERHWSDRDKNYFKNNLYTLIVLLSDKENPHKDEILKKYDMTKDYTILPIFFMILEGYDRKEVVKRVYTDLFERIKEEYYKIRDSEKIYVAWILWKYRRLLSSRIKEIREIVLSYISIISDRIDRFKGGTPNLETAFAYDLLYDFEKRSRIAFEEVPFIFRFFGIFNGLLFIMFILIVDFNFWRGGYLHHKGFLSLATLANTMIVLITVLGVYLSGFLIYEVGFKGICANEEMKEKLKEWLVQKYFWGFVVSGVIIGFVTQLI